MRTGDIWENSATDNVDLFETVSHFRVTAGILNGGWKESENQHPWKWELFSILLDIWYIVRTKPWSIK